MASVDVVIRIQDAHQKKPRLVDGVKVDIYPSADLEDELGGLPDTSSSPSTTDITATEYTGTQQKGVARFNDVQEDVYWARATVSGGVTWRLVKAG